MSPLSVFNKAPGVYIEEVQLPGPIPGVGTSTAAFIGPAQKGPINQPTFLTNPTQFQNTFGDYITDPMRVYVTHAVQGFFENGGTTCYFMRVGTGRRSWLKLKDISSAARPTLVVTAKQEGKAGDAITVQVNNSSIVNEVLIEKATATLKAVSKRQATVDGASDSAAADSAKQFRPGDVVLIGPETGGTNERATIASISGATLTFQSDLAHTYAAGTNIRIADIAVGQRRIRLKSTEGIEPGSYIKLTQATTPNATETVGVVHTVERANNALILEKGISTILKMVGTDPDIKLKTLEFKLTIAGVEFPNLSIDSRHSRYFANVVNSPVADVTLPDPPNPTLPPNNLPVEVTTAQALGNGEDEDITKIQTTHYREAITRLEKIDDVNILCIPDSVNPDGFGKDPMEVQEVQAAMIAHCEKMQDRFAVLDPRQPTANEKTANTSPLDVVTSQRGFVSSDAGYAAFYYPWITISNPTAPGRLTVPPSGHISGVYARVDSLRGVHKAPANEPIRGALAVEQILTDDEQGPLNEQGVNIIRLFTGRGVVVWGARTIAPKDRTQWRYVNVRRLLLFVEESIQEGTQFAVFEPNDLALWQKVKRQVTEFLTRVWRDGALFGATPEEAFRVRVDEELNPPEVRALGQLIIEVILFPTTPAEFVVFRIIQKPGGGTFEEV